MSSSLTRGEMCAARELRAGGGGDPRVVVAEQQGAVPAEVIDVFVTVDIPLAGTGGVAGVEPVGFGVARNVYHATRQIPTGRVAELGRFAGAVRVG